MLKYLGIGFFMTLVAVMISYFIGDWNVFLKITGFAALVPLLLSGMLTGAFISGDQIRANFHKDTKEDRRNKNKWVFRFLLIGVPNLIIVAILLVDRYLN